MLLGDLEKGSIAVYKRLNLDTDGCRLTGTGTVSAKIRTNKTNIVVNNNICITVICKLACLCSRIFTGCSLVLLGGSDSPMPVKAEHMLNICCGSCLPHDDDI